MALGQVRVFHIPSSCQFADIGGDWLPVPTLNQALWMQVRIDWMPAQPAGLAGVMQKAVVEPGSRETDFTFVSAGPGSGGAGCITWALMQ